MKTGTRVIVTFPDSDDLEPFAGKVIQQKYGPGTEQIVKVRGDDGLNSWYPESWVKPLLKTVE